MILLFLFLSLLTYDSHERASNACEGANLWRNFVDLRCGLVHCNYDLTPSSTSSLSALDDIFMFLRHFGHIWTKYKRGPGATPPQNISGFRFYYFSEICFA